LAVIGFDLFLHAGILSPLYEDPGTFLLPSETAFKRIPLGYLAFAILNIMLVWLMVKYDLKGMKSGFKFGLIMGLFIWVALSVGLASISTAPYFLLIGWAAGQAMELGLAGAIIGIGLERRTLKKLSLWCIVIFFACAIIGVVIQNILKL
jgi:hypothetical protein